MVDAMNDVDWDGGVRRFLHLTRIVMRARFRKRILSASLANKGCSARCRMVCYRSDGGGLRVNRLRANTLK